MTKIFESLKGYRTLIVNAILALVGIFVALGVLSPSEAAGVTQESVSANLDAIIGALGIAGAAVNILLRLVTNTKAGKQSPEAPKVTG